MKPVHFIALALAASALLSGCERQRDAPPQTPAASQSTAPQAELQMIDDAVGTGEAIAAGQVAVVHYTGWLYDANAPQNRGKKFDSSRDRGRPFRFVVGGGEVIAGWDQGVQGMQVGGRRQLIVPAHLGYGEGGARGVIPPGATLLFEVELLGIEAAGRR